MGTRPTKEPIFGGCLEEEVRVLYRVVRVLFGVETKANDKVADSRN